MDTDSSFDPKFLRKNIRSKAGRLLLKGPAGYRKFEGLTARYVTPDQAEQVRGRVHQAIVVLTVSLALLLALHFMAWPIFWRFTPHPIQLFAKFNDLESALILFGAAFYSCRFPGTYGSVFLFPWNALCLVFGMSVSDDLGAEIRPAAMVWGVIMVFGTLGWLFDYSIQRLRQKRQGWAAFILVLVLGFYVGLITLDKRWAYGSAHPIDPPFIPWSSLVFAVACGVILIGCWARRSDEGPEKTEESLCRWALQRWQIHIAGIGLATVLCIFPLISFLGFMDLHDRVIKDSTKDMVYYQNQAEFWDEKGDFVVPEDFENEDLFYLPREFWQKVPNRAVDLLEQLKRDPHNESLLDQTDLELKHAGRLITVDTVQNHDFDISAVYRLVGYLNFYKQNAVAEIDAELARPSGVDAYHLDHVPFDIEPVDFNSLWDRLTESYFYQVILVFLGVFGGIILWRRGGDSWPARITGLWLLSLFAMIPCNFEAYFVPALSYQCSLIAMKPTGLAASSALGVLIAVLDSTNLVIYLFTMLGFPVAWLWTYFCWPSRYPPGNTHRINFGWHFLIVWAVYCLILNGIPYLAVVTHPQNPDISGLVALALSQPIVIFAMVGLGLLLRKQYSSRNLPSLGPWPVAAFMLLQMVWLMAWCFSTPFQFPLPRMIYAVPLLLLVAGISLLVVSMVITRQMMVRLSNRTMPKTEKWVAAGIALLGATAALCSFCVPGGNSYPVTINLADMVGVLAVGVTFLTLLRTGFLNLQAVEDLSYVLVIVAVPVLMELFQAILQLVLFKLPLVSEDGVLVISVFLSISLYPRVHHILGHLCQRFSSPRLHEIEEVIEEAIENLVDLRVDSEKQAHLRDLFGRIHVSSYALYVRRSQGEFERFISEWQGAPEELFLSLPLQKFLRNRNAFTDFLSVPNAWASFFYQFELRRLEDSFLRHPVDTPPLTCRYLLPICIGKTVCALLLLPDRIGEINRRPFAGVLNSLGVAALTHKVGQPL
jgi:hypothetical protein